MARFARVVVPGCAYHLTHRGNRGDAIFFDEGDRSRYGGVLRRYADRYGMRVWAYCLMTNHVHLLAVPDRVDSLAFAIGNAHREYARGLNRSKGWSGHLWANRFFSTPLDDEHLWAAVRYVELNPVRAKITRHAAEYPWSSARAHVRGTPDPLLHPDRPFPGCIEDWTSWLESGLDPVVVAKLRDNTSTGRPTGSADFTARLERELSRVLAKKKRGRKPGRRVSPRG